MRERVRERESERERTERALKVNNSGRKKE